MENGAAHKTARRQEPESDLRLDSWKQVAAYLNRHMTTVRRWERCEGLPVHRHLHSSLGSIYAYSKELDAWLLKRRSAPLPVASPPIVATPMERHDSPFVAGPRIRLGLVPLAPVRLLGREKEFQAINEAWWRSSEGGQELVFVTGESGIGKTRLVSDFATSIGCDANVFAGHCDRPPHLPFTPFVEILHEIHQSIPAEILRECLSEIDGSTELAHLAPEFSRLIRPASACAATTLEGHRFRMFEAFTGLIRALTRRAPVLLAIEDIQWADEGSMLMLRYLVRSARDIALCSIVTCCETELQQVRWSAELLADLRREASATRVELAGLADDGIRCFVDEWMGQSAPANLIRFVTESTQGNPLFMTEMLRHLRETGTVASVKVLGADANLVGLSLPASIREAIDRRVSRLSHACNTLLMVASVAGRDFRLLLAEVVTQLPENVLLDALDEAVAADILREVPGSRGVFSFTHALLREVIYSRQNAERRIRLHHHLAEAVERHSDPADLPLADLAYHFGRAAGYKDAQKAVHYAVLAGERATATLALEEAASYYQLALDAIQFLPINAENRRKRCDLHFRRARSFSQAGQWGSAKKDLEAAVSLTGINEKEGLAELHVSLAEASFWVLDIPGVRHYAGEGQRLADEAARADLSADALAWKASAQAADGDVAGAIQSEQRAVARAGGICSFALARAPLTLYWAGRTEAAADQARQAVAFARESGDAAFLLYALQHQGLSLAGLGEYDKAVRIFDEACAFGKRCGALPLLARAMCMSVAPFLSLGDLEGARTRALEARELAHRAAFDPPLVSAGIDLLIINARLHDPGGSETLLRETRAAVEQAGGWHAWKWRLRLAQAHAELALARHNWKDAITAASHVVGQSRTYGRPKYEALGLATRARAVGRLGLRPESADARASVEIARRLGDPSLLLECLSVLLELDGSDEMRNEAQHIVNRIAGALSQESWRSRFLKNVSSNQQLTSIVKAGALL
jgi:tetratricopeptide (TPR) repeat protein